MKGKLRKDQIILWISDHQKDQKMDFSPRPAQIEVLQYTLGTMGISAVPGSGKTHTLSALAAQLIAGGKLEEGNAKIAAEQPAPKSPVLIEPGALQAIHLGQVGDDLVHRARFQC